jgi:hypothetical protein
MNNVNDEKLMFAACVFDRSCPLHIVESPKDSANARMQIDPARFMAVLELTTPLCFLTLLHCPPRYAATAAAMLLPLLPMPHAPDGR